MPYETDRPSVEPAKRRLIEAMKRHGRTIVIAEPGSEDERYLDSMGAEANVGGPELTHILVRQYPSKIALLEEFLHGTQWQLGIVQRLGIVRAEIAVTDFMIRHSRLLGISDQDVYVLQVLNDDSEPEPEADVTGPRRP